MDSFSSSEALDIAIEDAKTKKKTVDSKMESIMNLMREVELREKDAEKAKQEVDDCSLYINAEMDELILAQRLAKETNYKRAREVDTQKSDLATKMNELHFCLMGVLDDGDGCLATIDEMCKSLEKRLTSAIIKKEAADREKLAKEVALAYHKNQMEKLVEESNRLEQQAIENLKLQEFLIDRAHVVNMLQEDVSCKCQDVNLLKVELEDCQDESEISEDYFRPKIQDTKLPTQRCEYENEISSVIEDDLRPIIQDMISRQSCECYKCNNTSKGAKEILRTNKICKSRIMNLKNKEMKKWIKGQITEAVADHEEECMF